MLHGKLYRDLLPKAIDSANLMMNIEHYERRECLYFFHPLRYLKQFNSAHGQAIQNEL